MLMTKRPVNVFQVPPVTSAAGHYAESWRGKQMWTGDCQVKTRNSSKCVIQLVNADGSMFVESVF